MDYSTRRTRKPCPNSGNWRIRAKRRRSTALTLGQKLCKRCRWIRFKESLSSTAFLRKRSPDRLICRKGSLWAMRRARLHGISSRLTSLMQSRQSLTVQFWNRRRPLERFGATNHHARASRGSGADLVPVLQVDPFDPPCDVQSKVHRTSLAGKRARGSGPGMGPPVSGIRPERGPPTRWPRCLCNPITAARHQEPLAVLDKAPPQKPTVAGFFSGLVGGWGTGGSAHRDQVIDPLQHGLQAAARHLAVGVELAGNAH